MLIRAQGAQIMDDAFCGGPDGVSVNSTGRLVAEAVARQTRAIVMMGNPRHVDGLVYNVGTAVLPGVSLLFFSDGLTGRGWTDVGH